MNTIHHHTAAAALILGMLAPAACVDGPTPGAPGAPNGEAQADLSAGEDRRAAVALAIEQAERRIDTGRELGAARRSLDEALADPAAAPEQRDQARLAMSRLLEAEGDREGAIAAVEALLGERADSPSWPLQSAAEERLRLLLTGRGEAPLPGEPGEHEHTSPFARALARYFPAPEAGPREIEIEVHSFGGSREVSDRLGTFALAPAIRELRREACPRCDDRLPIHARSSRTGSWVGIPAARARLGSSLAVFYFDLGDLHIPARYDAELPLPSAEVVERLSKGEGLIAARERSGAPPVILIAAPRRAQLPAVEEALAAMEALPAAPVAVPLPKHLLRDEIQAVVRGQFGRFRVCYEELLERSPAAAGTIPLDFAILGDGTVADVKVDPATTTLRDATLEACMVEATRALRFPAAGEKTTVVYPIELSPGG
ncbi:AgmX/PglI C-terminal domain-containing protein [Sorangium sp. So ce131]|uniref:AgmX/PglI C-terminal domain-containing protein n=1 Tax=Sorangium sp. So ce131 TaxID=3133282 RepID=UPI003F630FE5